MSTEGHSIRQELGDHFRQVLRGAWDKGALVNSLVNLLVVNAARWKAGTDGTDPPHFPDLPSYAGRDLTAATLQDLLERERAWLASCPPGIAPRYVPELLRTASVFDRSREFLTSDSVTKVVVGVMSAGGAGRPGDESLTVYDPACGSGSLALDVIEALSPAGSATLAGQDINPSSVIQARANAFLRGVDARIERQDSLTGDAFAGRHFDFAVSDSPLGLSSWRFARLLLSKLRAPADGGGRAVLLMPEGPLSKGTDDPARRCLIEDDLLKTVIALPAGLSHPTAPRLYALVLSNAKPHGLRGKVHFIDLRGFHEEAPQERGERRSITAAGLQELSRGLARRKPNTHSRVVPVTDLRYRRAHVLHQVAGVRPVEVELAAGTDLVAWGARRYHHRPPAVEDSGSPEMTLIDIDRVLRSSPPPRLLREIDALKWPVTHLTELVRTMAYVRSARAADRADALAAAAGPRALMLPIEPHRDAVVGDPAEEPPAGRMIVLRVDEDTVDPDFLAGWLNSPLGHQVRRTALLRGNAEYVSPRTMSPAGLWRALDDILVVLPELSVQRELARTEEVLDAAGRRLRDFRKELWNDPRKRSGLYRQASLLTRSGDLADWAHDLPFPLAGALWALESRNDNVHARHRQMFLFWDCAIEFHATVLLSALAQDRSWLVGELAQFTRQFTGTGLTPQRASLGVWQILLQRLSRLYRQHLTGADADEHARVQAAFADPPSDLVESLTSTEVLHLLESVVTLRNNWSGHGGTAGEEILNGQLDVLTGHLHSFRNAIGGVWRDYPLVRAGASRRVRGIFDHDVEIAMGPSTPFRREQVKVSSALEDGGLYFLSRDAGRTLPLLPLIQLRPAGYGRNSACFFYNRIQPDGVRFVPYQDTTETELVTPNSGVTALIDALTSGDDADWPSGFSS